MPHPAKEQAPVERQELKRTVAGGPNKAVAKKGARRRAPDRAPWARPLRQTSGRGVLSPPPPLPSPEAPLPRPADGHNGWGQKDDVTVAGAAMDKKDPNYNSEEEDCVMEASA